MKTFNDIQFEPHHFGMGLIGRLMFENGYGVSVVRFKSPFGGYGSYTSNESEWELAVTTDEGLYYDTPITDDVLGHLTADEVTDVMRRVQELPTIN